MLIQGKQYPVLAFNDVYTAMSGRLLRSTAMSINLHRLHVYCVVVEQQSIRRASELLEVTQPVVSRLVAELERHYATDLLVRQGRGVVPTSAGMTVYRY